MSLWAGLARAAVDHQAESQEQEFVACVAVLLGLMMASSCQKQPTDRRICSDRA